MTLDELKTYLPAEKSARRRIIRRMLTIATRAMLRPQPADMRAYLTGYIDFARKALEALQ